MICEKPLACTPAEAAAIVDAASANGVTIKVGANLRYFENVEKAHELLVMGSIGEPLSLRGWIGNDGWPTHSWFSDPACLGAEQCSTWVVTYSTLCVGSSATLGTASEPRAGYIGKFP